MAFINKSQRSPAPARVPRMVKKMKSKRSFEDKDVKIFLSQGIRLKN
ncbi:MAG: hypothetical protein Q7S36_00835 [Candidatus Liptonbacteria bacterium]|nr:hypothetical protein [Candidatus Liptonbacteria bacterium]